MRLQSEPPECVSDFVVTAHDRRRDRTVSAVNRDIATPEEVEVSLVLRLGGYAPSQAQCNVQRIYQILADEYYYPSMESAACG